MSDRTVSALERIRELSLANPLNPQLQAVRPLIDAALLDEDEAPVAGTPPQDALPDMADQQIIEHAAMLYEELAEREGSQADREAAKRLSRVAASRASGTAPEVGKPCPTCGRDVLPPMGPGDYSCAACGMGMMEPCEHWKKMLAENPPSDESETDERAASGTEGSEALDKKYCQLCDAPLTLWRGRWVSDTPNGPKAVCHPKFGDHLHSPTTSVEGEHNG